MNYVSQTDMANFDNLKFALDDVLFDRAPKIIRKNRLLRAMVLNYFEHQTVTISFKNNNNDIFALECSIIAVTDEHVMLKSGIVIPIKSILMVE